MKTLLLPDLHCYPATHSRPDDSGLPSRYAEWKRCADELVEWANLHRPDLILAPGDYFTNSRPSALQVLAVRDLFASLSRVAPVVGCAGNHDLVGPGKPGPVSLLSRMTQGQGDWGLEQPGVVWLDVAGCKVAVAVLPSARPAFLYGGAQGPLSRGETGQWISDRLLNILRKLRIEAREGGADLALLMGHWTIGGARVPRGFALVGGPEPVLDHHELVAQEWDGVYLGHIHKAQRFENVAPFCGYAGALLRGDFGEEGETRGAWLVETGCGPLLLEVSARNLLTITLEANDLERLAKGTSPAKVLESWADEVEEAIVRVRYQTTDELAKRINNQALLRELENMGAHLVAGVFPEIIRADRTRAEVSESTDPLASLRAWATTRRELTADLREQVVAKAMELMKGEPV